MPGYARTPGLGSGIFQVIKYADASARDAAIPSPSEGQTVYLISLKTIQVYNGTTWTAIAGGSDINPLLLAGT
jgi:hypothetical protein